MRRFFTLTLLAMLSIAASAYDFGAVSPYSYTVMDPVTHQSITRTDVSHMIYYAINSDGKTVTVVEGPEVYAYDYVSIPEQVVNPNDGKTYTVKAIGTEAFSCSNLIEIVLANTIEEIQENAFSGSSVVNVYFPTGLKYVRDYAFNGAWQLLKVYLHDGLLSIGSNAFSTCGGPCNIINPYCSTALQLVRLPESATTIRDRAFSGNKSLVSINLPMNLKEIEEGLLADCPSLQEIVLPTAVEKIHGYAFDGAGLTSIEFPSKLKEIEEYAFRGTNITELILPTTLQIVGEGAFQGCPYLTEATVNYAMKELPDYLFSGCSGLQKATINTNITKIGADAFSNCVQLVDVTLPNSLTEIGASAFAGCVRLSAISLPNNVATMGMNAFAYSGLTRFTFPTKLTYISENMFLGCEKLSSLTVPSTINEIRDLAFSSCTSLRSISLPETLTSLPYNCFSSCSVLTTVNIPSTVTEIGSYCFSDCSSLVSITLPDALEILGGGCFSGCTKLASITIPSKVKELEGYTFMDCKSLTDVSLPTDMHSIWDMEFGGCEKLTSITLPLALDEIMLSSFSECKNLTTVNLPSAFVPNTASSLDEGNKATLYVPRGTKAEYENATDLHDWSSFYKIVEKDFTSCMYRVEANTQSDYGIMLVNDENTSYTYSNTDEQVFKFKALEGSNVKVEIQPYEEQLMRYTLLCNGADVTNRMTDNIYIIENVQENKVLEMIWEEGAPNGYQLITAKNSGSQGWSTLLVGGQLDSQWYDDESNPIYKFKTGSNVTLTIYPAEEYLEKYTLFVNGIDVTSQIVGNEYVIKNIQSDTQVEVVFEDGTPNGYHLVTTSVPDYDGVIYVNGEEVPYYDSWYDAENRPRFKVEAGSDVAIWLESYYFEWPQYTLYANGNDVSAQVMNGEYTIKNIQEDVLLEAWFQEGVPTGIDGISEMEAGQAELYNLQGQRVEKPIAGHIYVTKDGKKIVVRKNTK